MAAAAWQASEAEIAAIVGARHGDPFAILGPHMTGDGQVIRALVPGAVSVRVRGPDGAMSLPMTSRDPAGFFEVLLPRGTALLATGCTRQTRVASGSSMIHSASGPCLARPTITC